MNYKTKLTPDQRADIVNAPRDKRVLLELAQRFGISANYVIELWERHHPEVRTCDCGNPAVRYTTGGFVCQRCFDLEQRQNDEESFRHEQKLAPWQRGLYSKYVDGFRTGTHAY